MKKVISVFLAALMLISCFAMASFAVVGEYGETCECEDCVAEYRKCTCCVYCSNPDKEKWNSCYDEETGGFCCNDCNGIYPDCGCRCKPCCTGDQNSSSNDSTFGDAVSDETKEELVSGFQAVLKRISDFFDSLFDSIFEFLRIDDILGTN